MIAAGARAPAPTNQLGEPLQDAPLLEQMSPEERDRFLRSVAAFLLSSVLEDLERDGDRGRSQESSRGD